MTALSLLRAALPEQARLLVAQLSLEAVHPLLHWEQGLILALLLFQ